MIAMIFLERTSVNADGTPRVEIAVAEHEQTAAHYETLGFQRCSFAAFRAAWQRRDTDEFARLRVAEHAAAPRHAPEGVGSARAARAYPHSS